MKTYALYIVTVMAGLLLFPDMLLADTPAGTCSTDPTFNVPQNINIIQSIVNQIQCVLYGGCGGNGSVAENLFNTLAGSPSTGYGVVIMTILTLFIIIFAKFH